MHIQRFKNAIVFTLILFGLFFFQQVHAEQIDKFDVEIKINNDSSIDVLEKITYNFGSLQKHGIFRDIPYKYKARGGSYNLRISNFNVTDVKGNPIKFDLSNVSNNKRIKIGDADKFVSGIREYHISYKVQRAINNFDEHNELYWNATGNEWPISILQARTKVVFPQQINQKEVNYECFQGAYGSKTECLYERLEHGGKDMLNAIIFVSDSLAAKEGMTVVVGIPRGIIKEFTVIQNAKFIIMDNWIVSLPFLTLIVMFLLWRKYGKDPEGRGTIIAQFNAPKGLTPAEVGLLLDEKVDNYDITADVINLAIKGFLKITRLKKDGKILKESDYILEKIKDSDESLSEYEKQLLDGLFEKDNIDRSLKSLNRSLSRGGNKLSNEQNYQVLSRLVSENGLEKKSVVLLSKLEEKFYKIFSDLKKNLYKSLTERGFFTKNPIHVRGKYIGIGVVLMMLSIPLFSIYGFLGVVSLVLSGIIVIIFGYFMPSKTKTGKEALEHILGLREYIRVAEKDRIKFHNAPEKNPKIFETLLPFAIVFKAEKAWAKQFEDIYNMQPEWYNDTSRSSFSSSMLAVGIGKFNTSASSALTSAPQSSASSGGSGFSGGGSGGGFGGGGGGSW